MAEMERTLEKLANRKGNKGRSTFEVGQRVMLQNTVGNEVWEERGTIKEIRESDNSTVHSNYVTKDSGYNVVQYKPYFKPLSEKRNRFAENLT